MNIPYGRQNVTPEDIDAVVDVLKSPFLTQGPAVPKFENSLCEFIGCKFAVAMNSATSALHVAVTALGLRKGDILWTSPITFVASANCGLYCGAAIDFVDIDPVSFNMCPNELEKKLIAAKTKGKLPQVVVIVHMAGQSADMQSIHALSKKYRFKIVEDASHAIGGTYLNKKVGSCKYSDITVFSFHPVKIITTGEGGVAVTNNEEIASKMQKLRSHGISRNPKDWTQTNNDAWYYEMLDLGFNYRLTDLQAALGLSQMTKLSQNIIRRNNLAANYENLLNKNKLVLPTISKKTYSSYHLYIVQVRNKACKSAVFREMREKGVGVNVHYIPVHLQPYYLDLGFKPGDFPKSEAYYEGAITIPLYPTLSLDEQTYVSKTLNKALEKWT